MYITASNDTIMDFSNSFYSISKKTFISHKHYFAQLVKFDIYDVPFRRHFRHC